MRCRHWLFAALVLIAASSSLPALAAPSCIDADISIDAGHHALTMQLTLPHGVATLALAPIDGYHRQQLWRSPDGSAVITDSTLRPTHPQQRRLRVSMDVRANLDKPDRTYPPFLRFADGTVALDSDTFAAATNATPLCLHFIPAPGEQVIGYGRVSDHPLRAPAAPAPAGYVAFGTPRVERHPSLLLVSDRQAPAWIRRQLGTTIPAVADYYRQQMGPMATPIVFLYDMPDAHGSGYHGDRLPASVTLGLIGDAWKTPDASAAHQLIGFVAHELFHVWNVAHDMEPADDESDLASEGGAELARMFATAHIEGHAGQVWLAEAGTSLNNCLLALPAHGSLAAGHLDHGRLPYDCGVPVMLVLAAMHDPQDPVAGYFRAWRTLIERKRVTSDHRYRWTELAPASAASSLLATLDHAIHGDASYAADIRKALSQVGFEVTREPTLTASMRQRMNMRLMQALMAQDCAGRVSFWNKPSGFLLDHPLPQCRTLTPGGLVVSLLGQPLQSDRPIALAAAIRTRCAAGGRISAGYADGAPVSELDCPTELPTLPEPLKITSYRAH